MVEQHTIQGDITVANLSTGCPVTQLKFFVAELSTR